MSAISRETLRKLIKNETNPETLEALKELERRRAADHTMGGAKPT